MVSQQPWLALTCYYNFWFVSSLDWRSLATIIFGSSAALIGARQPLSLFLYPWALQPQKACCKRHTAAWHAADALKSHIYISISIYVYISKSISISMYIYLYVSIYIYLYIDIYLYIYIYKYVYIYIYVYVYRFVSLSLYIYIYIIHLCI